MHIHAHCSARVYLRPVILSVLTLVHTLVCSKASATEYQIIIVIAYESLRLYYMAPDFPEATHDTSYLSSSFHKFSMQGNPRHILPLTFSALTFPRSRILLGTMKLTGYHQGLLLSCPVLSRCFLQYSSLYCC